MCLCHPCISSSIYESNIQHSMSVFHKENTVLLKNKFQAILPTTMLEHFLIINNFCASIIMKTLYCAYNCFLYDQAKKLCWKYYFIYNCPIQKAYISPISWSVYNTTHSIYAEKKLRVLLVNNYNCILFKHTVSVASLTVHIFPLALSPGF